MTKRIGSLIQLDPTKKYLVVIDKSEMDHANAREIVSKIRDMRGGAVQGILLNDITKINFVEVEGEIAMETEEEVVEEAPAVERGAASA